MTMTVTLYETNGDTLVIARDDEAWGLGAITPDFAGYFGLDARAWIDGDWDPSDSDGQVRTSADGLTAVATYDHKNGVRLLVPRGGLGAAARIYLTT